MGHWKWGGGGGQRFRAFLGGSAGATSPPRDRMAPRGRRSARGEFPPCAKCPGAGAAALTWRRWPRPRCRKRCPGRRGWMPGCSLSRRWPHRWRTPRRRCAARLEVGAGQVRSGQFRSGQVRSGQGNQPLCTRAPHALPAGSRERHMVPAGSQPGGGSAWTAPHGSGSPGAPHPSLPPAWPL